MSDSVMTVKSGGAFAVESPWVQVVKTLLLALCAFGYTWPLVTGTGHMAVAVAAAVASLLALGATALRLRLPWCLALSVLIAAVGTTGSALTLDVFGFINAASTIKLSRYWYFVGAVPAVIFMTRTLALRYRTAHVLESCLAIGTLVFLFFAHRDFHLTEPREFADYLFAHEYDPVEIYRYMGVAAAFLSLPLLFGRVRFGRALYSMAILAALALILANFGRDTHLPVSIEDPLGLFADNGDDGTAGGGKEGDEDGQKRGGGGGVDDEDADSNGGGGRGNDRGDGHSGDGGSQSGNGNGGNRGDGGNGDGGAGGGSGKGDGDDKSGNGNGGQDKGKSGSSSGNSSGNGGGSSSGNNNDGPTGREQPVPVAVAVFYDEFEPDDGIFHFRQNVLSRYDGNHLVGSEGDDDVISVFPTTDALEAVPIQNPALHQTVSTSMFLTQPLSAPPQVAMGQRVFPIQNPDPKIYVSAYAVESVGLTMDISRLLGRKSIPDTWSLEQRAHYLAIPDDPRYKALSDIIVRRIDPTLAGDDLVKALYIKSWLEKEGFYTRNTRHIDKSDPTASFLFGSLRGYCVHFAHAAALLFRSQGIASRVAIGYAVDNSMRGTNSAVLIMANQAHAWPEIHLDGVGWITLDIFPEHSDEPPPEFIDRDLESLFGELARNDKSGGRAPEPVSEARGIPFGLIGDLCIDVIVLLLALCYMRKIILVLSGYACGGDGGTFRSVRGAVFVWAMFGHDWRRYGTLESFARSEAGDGSATLGLVIENEAVKMGSASKIRDVKARRMSYTGAIGEARARTSVVRRVLGWINPWPVYR